MNKMHNAPGEMQDDDVMDKTSRTDEKMKEEDDDEEEKDDVDDLEGDVTKRESL